MTTTSPNTLILPFRAGAHVSYGDAIRKYINNQYDQHPDMFREDLEVLDALRRDAVTVREAHVSGVDKLQAYAAQLVWIGGKFPIDIGVEFPWHPAFGVNDRPALRNNLKYELLNVLYNLASLYCHLADSTSRSTPEGIKVAASYFSLAAGVLQHLHMEVVPALRMSDIPEDLDIATLKALQFICLAQAQECWWQKAVTDQYKDSLIAKLAACVGELYGQAKEESIKSTSIPVSWIRHMATKQGHFTAAALYRASRECLEKRQYGLEVARLREALVSVTEGLRETKSGLVNKGVVKDLNGLKKRIEADLKRAEKDNDIIYLQTVPTKTEMKPLEKTNMAVAKCPPQVSTPLDYLGKDSDFGLPLFSKLIPFAVHIAISIYEERRDRLVTKEIMEPLKELEESLNATLDSLGLPGSLQAIEKPLGLPPSLTQRAEELRQANALTRIEEAFNDNEALKTSDLALFEEGKQFLLNELEQDNAFRQTYGAAWTRATSKDTSAGAKLWKRMGEIEGYFAQAISSDELLRDKFDSIRAPLGVLCGSPRALQDYVPSSRRQDIPDSLRAVITRVRSSYNDVLRLQSRRRKRMEIIQEKARMDEVRSDMIREVNRLERVSPGISVEAETLDPWIEQRLETLYEPEMEAVASEEAEQGRVVAELTHTTREFESQKRAKSGKGTMEREEVLQRLNSAYERWKEILRDVESGRGFYNQLQGVVGTMFRDVAKSWANDRRLEAEAMEEEILLPPLARARITSPVPVEEKSYQEESFAPSVPESDDIVMDTEEEFSMIATPARAIPVPVPAAILTQEPDLVHEVVMSSPTRSQTFQQQRQQQQREQEQLRQQQLQEQELWEQEQQREQQLVEAQRQEEHRRQQQVREQRRRDEQLREQQYREQQAMEEERQEQERRKQQQQNEQKIREQQQREQQQRQEEQEFREQQRVKEQRQQEHLREQQRREQRRREEQLREQQHQEQLREQKQREQQEREEEELREQQLIEDQRREEHIRQQQRQEQRRREEQLREQQYHEQQASVQKASSHKPTPLRNTPSTPSLPPPSASFTKTETQPAAIPKLPVAPSRSPVSGSPTRTAWTPDMGIRFEGLPSVPGGAPSDPARKKTVWDPAAGIKFG